MTIPFVGPHELERRALLMRRGFEKLAEELKVEGRHNQAKVALDARNLPPSSLARLHMILENL